MKVNPLAIAAALNMTIANYVYCTSIASAAVPATPVRLVDEYKRLCPSDYVHLTTYDGSTVINPKDITGRRQGQSRGRRHDTNQTLMNIQVQQEAAVQLVPITIVIHGRLSIENNNQRFFLR